MSNYIDILSLVDLISEKHKKLRKLTLEKYEENGVLKLTEMEYYLISLLRVDNMTISESARKMNISRQAVHKFSKELKNLELIEIKHSENNKRDKFLSLTKKGSKLLNETENIKLQIEKDICDIIGTEKVSLLKKVLRERWIKD